VSKEYLKGCEPKQKDIDEDNIQKCFNCGEPFDMYDLESYNIIEYLSHAHTIDNGLYNSSQKQCKQCFLRNIVYVAQKIIQDNPKTDFGFFLAQKIGKRRIKIL